MAGTIATGERLGVAKWRSAPRELLLERLFAHGRDRRICRGRSWCRNRRGSLCRGRPRRIADEQRLEGRLQLDQPISLRPVRRVLDEPREIAVNPVERRRAPGRRLALLDRGRAGPLAPRGATIAPGERLGALGDLLHEITNLELLHVGRGRRLLAKLDLVAAEVDLLIVVEARLPRAAAVEELSPSRSAAFCTSGSLLSACSARR